MIGVSHKVLLVCWFTPKFCTKSSSNSRIVCQMVEEGPRLSFQSTEACRAIVNPPLWISLQVSFFFFFFFSFLRRKRREGERGKKKKKASQPAEQQTMVSTGNSTIILALSYPVLCQIYCLQQLSHNKSVQAHKSCEKRLVKKDSWFSPSSPPPPESFPFASLHKLHSPEITSCLPVLWHWDLQPVTLLTASLQYRHLCLSVLTEWEVTFCYSSHFYLIANAWK